MRGVSLTIDRCKGWSGGSAVATSTDRLVYVSGCHVVVHSYDSDGGSGGAQSAADVRVLRFGSASVASERPATSSPSKAAGRAKAVSCVDVSPDGRYVVAGETGHCPRIGVWDLEDASPLPRMVVYDRHTFGIKHVRFNRSSSRFLSVGVANDGAIHVFSLKSASPGACQLLASNRVTNALRDVRWLTDTVIATCGVRHLKLFTVPPTDEAEPERVGVLDARQVVLGQLLDETIVGVASDHDGGCRLLTATGVLAAFDLDTRTVAETDRFEDGRAILEYRGEIVVATRSGIQGHVQDVDIQDAMVLRGDLLLVTRRGDIWWRERTIASARPLAGLALVDGELREIHRDLHDAILTDSTASTPASSNRVTAVGVTPAGELLRGTASGELLIGGTAAAERRVHLHESAILHISACGTLVLTMAQDRTLQLLRGFELLQTWVEPRSTVTWAALADDRTVVLATLDRTLKWLALRSDGMGFELAKTVDLRATVVSGCVYSPATAASLGSTSGGDETAGAGVDGYLALRDRSIVRLTDPQCILARTEEVVDRLAVAGPADDYLVCSSSLDKRIYLLNRLIGRVVDRHDFLGQVVGIVSQPSPSPSPEQQQSGTSGTGITHNGAKIWVAAEDGQVTSFKVQADAQLASSSGAIVSTAATAASAEGRCASPLPARKVLMPRSHSSQGFSTYSKQAQHTQHGQLQQQQQQRGEHTHAHPSQGAATGQRRQSVLHPVSDNPRLSSPLKWHASSPSPSPSPSPTPTSGVAGRTGVLGRASVGIGAGGGKSNGNADGNGSGNSSTDRAGSNGRPHHATLQAGRTEVAQDKTDPAQGGLAEAQGDIDLLTQTLANLRLLRSRHTAEAEGQGLHEDDVLMLRLATRWLHEPA